LTLREGASATPEVCAKTSPEGATGAGSADAGSAESFKRAARSFSSRVALAMSDSSAFGLDETLGFGAGDGSESSSSKSSSP
jgi:hypothetical protein